MKLTMSKLDLIHPIEFLAWHGTLNTSLSGNDSNLLIVFYVQIMPDDLVMQLHRFWERQWLPSQPCQMLSQIQIMSLNALSVTLADNVQLSLQAWFIQRPIPRPQRPTAGSEDAPVWPECVHRRRAPQPSSVSCHTRKTASADVI